ncbi:MAG TPA: hypothetical protein VK517_19930 [Cyclobacteriaceae bacterium]|nr:hypothetical protein [Cyclobacteriaceae bacterium]
MIRCLIVDNQQQSIDSLKSCIDRMASLELVGTVCCSIKAIDCITGQNIQVLFAGIELCDGVSAIVRQKTHLIVLNDEYSPALPAIQQRLFFALYRETGKIRWLLKCLRKDFNA